MTPSFSARFGHRDGSSSHLPAEHVNGSAGGSIPVPLLERGGTESSPLATDAPLVLVPLGELGPSEEPDWLWRGYIARGAITLLSAYPKVGKTTLISYLLRDMTRGEGMAERPINGPVLIIHEEPEGIWMRRRDELGLDPDKIMLVRRQSFARTTSLGWRRLLEELVRQAIECGAVLVIIDTLPRVWPVANENDAAQVDEALAPLRELSNAGVAVVLVTHSRKKPGEQGTSTRGSSALVGFPDIIVELGRLESVNHQDRRRLLTAYGRYEEIPPETVINLTETGYEIIGERAEARAVDDQKTIIGLLSVEAPGITADEILDRWPPTSKIGKRRLMALLIHGADQHRWRLLGKGKRGDPYTFVRRPAMVGDPEGNAGADSIPFRDSLRGESESNPQQLDQADSSDSDSRPG